MIHDKHVILSGLWTTYVNTCYSSPEADRYDLSTARTAALHSSVHHRIAGGSSDCALSWRAETVGWWLSRAPLVGGFI